jgi:hypothetical protein
MISLASHSFFVKRGQLYYTKSMPYFQLFFNGFSSIYTVFQQYILPGSTYIPAAEVGAAVCKL